jgi:hypothetical protein
MTEVDGSGANGTARWWADAQLGGFAVLLEVPALGLSFDEHLFDEQGPPGVYLQAPLQLASWNVRVGSCATKPFSSRLAFQNSAGAGEAADYPEHDNFTDGFHSIVVYDDGVVVSCGDIPAVSPDDGTAHAEPVGFVDLTVEEWGGSGISGDAVLWARHDGVGVAAVASVAPRWWYDLHIHSGSCDAPEGAILHVQGRWVSEPTGTSGLGEAKGGVFGTEGLVREIDFATLRDGKHYIDFHAPSDGGAIVACSEIPGAESLTAPG